MNSHKNLASFDTLVDPEAAKVRNEMSWRTCNPVCKRSVIKFQRLVKLVLLIFIYVKHALLGRKSRKFRQP